VRTLPLWIWLVACGTSSPPAQPDAAADAASTIDAPFPCNGMSCDKATQYCYQIYAGLFQPVGCTALPAACTAQPTCDCIKPTITDCASGAVSCEEHDGAVTAACNLP
jgi:hypothetical protein